VQHTCAYKRGFSAHDPVAALATRVDRDSLLLFSTFGRLFDWLIIRAVVPFALVGRVLGLALLGQAVLIVSAIRARPSGESASRLQPSAAQVSGREPCS
jgi:hypothetical protein